MSFATEFQRTIFRQHYGITKDEDWDGCAWRVADFASLGDPELRQRFFEAIRTKKFMPGGRYLYAAGRPVPQNTNCFLLRAEDSREGWCELSTLHMMAGMMGGGVGTNYSALRPRGAPLKRFGGVASGPVSLMKAMNDTGRHIKAGAARRTALWAGLNWQHPDTPEFIRSKLWSEDVRRLKAQDFDFPAPLDQTNISTCLDDEFFRSMIPPWEGCDGNGTWKFFLETVELARRWGDPGWAVDVGDCAGEDLRNPCNEVTSRKHGDCCNLGSVNVARVKDLDEFEYLVDLGTTFLYNGTIAGVLPHETYQKVREEDRRIGLGLLGIHEWLLKRGHRYEPTPVLRSWLEVYRDASDAAAAAAARKHGLAVPVATRAIAPTGTIGILAGTTTGIEPITCVAFRRRFQDHGEHKFSYVVDPTAQRLIETGVDSRDVEDAYTLARDLERRLKMQAFIQEYVDQGISSTINLPRYGQPGNEDGVVMAQTILQYLPQLRGLTLYPDGARPGQPIESVTYEEAVAGGDRIFLEGAPEDACKGGACGI